MARGTQSARGPRTCRIRRIRSIRQICFIENWVVVARRAARPHANAQQRSRHQLSGATGVVNASVVSILKLPFWRATPWMSSRARSRDLHLQSGFVVQTRSLRRLRSSRAGCCARSGENTSWRDDGGRAILVVLFPPDSPPATKSSQCNAQLLSSGLPYAPLSFSPRLFPRSHNAAVAAAEAVVAALRPPTLVRHATPPHNATRHAPREVIRPLVADAADAAEWRERSRRF